MEYSESLKKNRDFKTVYGNGKSRANKYLVMYVMKNGTEKNRIGISVSKKVGNSVVRHHLTRLIREIYRLNEHHFKKGLDIIFIVRVNAKKIDYHTLEKALMHVQISTEFWKRAVMSKMSRILIAMIRFYRKYISPMKRGCCIYIPTCSQYAIEAIMKYGAVKGSYLAARRILRCHPFAKGGYDPVP